MKKAFGSAILVVLGASLASAAPGPNETTERVSYSETAPRHTPHTDGGWVDLASPTPASHGREYIDIGASAGKLTQLRIAAATGRPIVRWVRIEYVDGSHRVVAIDRVLDRNRKPAVIDLRGPREIDHVEVISERDSKGSYTIEGTAAIGKDVATR